MDKKYIVYWTKLLVGLAFLIISVLLFLHVPEIVATGASDYMQLVFFTLLTNPYPTFFLVISVYLLASSYLDLKKF
ncbi:hypothetical protein [Streptococcus merionis]|uniref:hypothetical protein n=1 Tax=Streptococcus merionis TaxID=400065 RepID=UPI003515D7D0